MYVHAYIHTHTNYSYKASIIKTPFQNFLCNHVQPHACCLPHLPVHLYSKICNFDYGFLFPALLIEIITILAPMTYNKQVRLFSMCTKQRSYVLLYSGFLMGKIERMSDDIVI